MIIWSKVEAQGENLLGNSIIYGCDICTQNEKLNFTLKKHWIYKFVPEYFLLYRQERTLPLKVTL